MNKIYLILIFCLMIGCENKIMPTGNVEKINNIDRVFMHEPNRFSFLVNDGLKTYHCHIVRFEYDVAKNKKIWVEKIETDYTNTFNLVIHLHDPQEVNGAGWSHNKGGNGQTVEIE